MLTLLCLMSRGPHCHPTSSRVWLGVRLQIHKGLNIVEKAKFEGMTPVCPRPRKCSTLNKDSPLQFKESS